MARASATKNKNSTEWHYVPMSEAERKAKAGEMADVVQEHDKVDEQRLNSARDFRKRMKGLEERLTVLAEEVRTSTKRVPAQHKLKGVDA